jgi:hypothetical protein
MRKCFIYILLIGLILFPYQIFSKDKNQSQTASLNAYQKCLEIIKNDTTFPAAMEECSETFFKRVDMWRFILGEADDSTKYVYNWKSSEILGSFEIPDEIFENNWEIQKALIRKVLISFCLNKADSMINADSLEAVERNASKKDTVEEKNAQEVLSDTTAQMTDSTSEVADTSVDRRTIIIDSIIEDQQQHLKIIKGKKKLIEDTFERMPGYIINIVNVLLEADLSPSFALAVGLESRYIDTIESLKGAAGLYQFIPKTGRGFGLIIDDVIDERFSEYHARNAFVKYMVFLHNEYIDYPFISLLSYFTGPIYYRDLFIDSLDQCEIIADSLPFASSSYIPSIVALRKIFLERFDELMEYTPPPVTIKKVVLPTEVNVQYLPSLFQCSKEELRMYNRQFRRGLVNYILPAQYTLFVPPDIEYFKVSKEWYDVYPIHHGKVTFPPFYASLEIIYSFMKMEPQDLVDLF